MTDIIETLRSLSSGDRIRVRTPDDETHIVRLIDDVHYSPPDDYGTGVIDVDIAIDTDVHEVPSDRYPSKVGTIMGTQSIGRDSIDPPLLTMWDPVYDVEDGERRIVDDEWVTLGRVAAIEHPQSASPL